MEKYNHLLGKSNGVSLNSHTFLVAKFAGIMCEILEVDPKHRKLVIASALLHDVGKIRSEFQKILHKDNTNDIKIYHNIDSWAVLATILTNTKEHKSILSSIYWHHPKPEPGYNKTFMNNASEILNEMSYEDIELIISYSKDILNSQNITLEFNDDDNEEDLRDITIPKLYTVDGDDAIPALIRKILVSSDRIASQYENQNDINDLLNNTERCYNNIKLIDEKKQWEIKKPIHYDITRFNNELNTVNDIKNNKTVIVKAPAGYGKTDIGLIWSALSNKKLLWVVPRNIIAYGIYNSIISDLKAYGLPNVSVELILSSNRKKCTHNHIQEFDSDIVVTNIDNFLYPTVKNKFGHRQLSICSRDVVFDEFHEFVQESALFYGFINMMKIRHRHTNSKTILLSATPIMINKHWESVNGPKTLIYPNEDEHLPAAHTKKYKIKVSETEFENFKNKIETDDHRNCLVVLNSIKNAQKVMHDTNSDVLIHSDFLDDDFDKNKRDILARYGKDNTNTNDMRVISTPILEASTDMSVQVLYESVVSPESSLQRIGRCNRWGNIENSEIHLFYFNNESENASRDINYRNSLSVLWFNELMKRLKDVDLITLDEIYVIYNRFCKENKTPIDNFIKQKLTESRMRMSKIYPSRDFNEVDDYGGLSADKTITSGIETLRGNNDNSYFFVCPYYKDKTKYIEPITEQITQRKYNQTIHQHFDENPDTLSDVYKIMKKIHHMYKYPRKYITEASNIPFTMDDLAKDAWNSNKPYIVPNWNYHKKYGIIANNTIKKFTKTLNL